MKKQKYLILKGEKIEVSEEVLRAYQTCWMSERRGNIKAKLHNVNYDFSEDIDNEYGFYSELGTEVNMKTVAEYPMCISAERAALKNIEHENLYKAINSLNKSDRQLIIGLFFYDLSIRELASKTGISKSSIQRREAVILKILKEKMKNF